MCLHVAQQALTHKDIVKNVRLRNCNITSKNTAGARLGNFMCEMYANGVPYSIKNVLIINKTSL